MLLKKPLTQISRTLFSTPLRGISTFTKLFSARKPQKIISKVLINKTGPEAGFTLIELMIVMSIIGILLTIAQPMYRGSTIKAKEAVLMENLFTLRDVIDQFYIDKERYPDSLEEMADSHYIRSVPKDPFTNSTETWQLMPPPEGYEGSLYDIHSGSDLLALNGTPYNEW